MNNYVKASIRFSALLIGVSCITLAFPFKNMAASLPFKSESTVQQYFSKKDAQPETGWDYDDKTKTLKIKNEASLFDYEDMYHEYTDYLHNRFEGSTPWEDKSYKIERVIVEEGVKKLPIAIFSDLDSLKEVTLPSTLTKLPKYAFYGCSSLEKLEIPDSITDIGFQAFYDCDNLKEITIGKGVKTIGINALGYCLSLERINVSPDNLYFSAQDGILFDKEIKTLVLAPPKYTNSVIIPDTVKTIGAFAFAYCKKLQQIEIPSQVEEISDGAFYSCSNLKEITFAKDSKCKKISDYTEYHKKEDTFGDVYGALENCRSLTALTFPDSLETIGYFTLTNCTSLKKIHFGSNFKSLIYKDAPFNGFSYEGLNSLANITVSSKNKTYTSNNGILYNKAKTRIFWYSKNKKEKSYTIPSKVKIIERSAFKNNKYLVRLDLSSVATIKSSAFSGCPNLETVKWSKKLKSIGSYAFYSCSRLKSFLSYGNNMEIKQCAFSNCTSLNSITLKNGTRYIGERAFSACPFQKVTVPSSVMTIENEAFNPPSKIAKKFTIYCKKNSAAHWFAKTYGYNYKYY